MRSMSATATEAVLKQYTDQVFLWLLEIDHDDLDDTLRFVNSREDIVSNGNNYIAFPFEITLPSDDGETISGVQLSISNVDRLITETIRGLATPAEVTSKIILASDPDYAEAGPFTMTMKSVTYNALTVTGTLSQENILDLAYPGYTFTPSGFPGLF